MKSAPQSNQPSTTTPHHRRPNGKVARLPEHLRDLVNQMLRDGFIYDAIIQKLREHGVSLLKSNLSHWRNGGHQDWLKQQVWLREMDSRLAFALDIVRNNDPGFFSKACSELAAIRLFQTLQNFHLHPPANDLKPDPMNFIRTTNAVCRLSSSVLQHKASKPLAADTSRVIPTSLSPQKSEPNRT